MPSQARTGARPSDDGVDTASSGAALLLHLLATGKDATALRGVAQASESEISDALAVRSQLTDHRERTASLAALMESMEGISGLDVLDHVLLSIVTRSRRLLLTEVAYFLTVDDETGAMEVRVSEGIVTDAFARLRVDPGVGISGLIAATRKPSVTRDYLSDTRYRHAAHIDTATRAEGLRGIVGVPVMKDGVVVGVLLAANRRQHDFSHQDVELLISLAHHAGVVIHNARVHERDLQGVRELQTAVAALQREGERAQQTIDFQDQLFSLLLDGSSLQALVDVVSATLGGAVRVLDERHALVAQAGPSPNPAGPARTLPLELKGGVIGYLTFDPAPGSDDVQEVQLTRAAQSAALAFSTARASVASSRLTSSRLISEILLDPQSDEVRVLGARLEIDLSRLSLVAVASVDQASHFHALQAAQSVAAARGGIAHDLGELLLLWVEGTDPAQTAHELSVNMTRLVGVPVTVAVGGSTSSPVDLRRALDESTWTLAAMKALGRTGLGGDEASVAPLPTVLRRCTPDELDDFVIQVLGPLIDYDQAHGTSLLTTLDTVYRHGLNAAAAGQELFLHTNTVHQRLSRIDQISGQPWRSHGVAMQRQLALAVRRLRSQGGRRPH